MLSGSMQFEKELKRVLQYATIWQGIVLLDEADIFLEERKDNSADRNALVASKSASLSRLFLFFLLSFVCSRAFPFPFSPTRSMRE